APRAGGGGLVPGGDGWDDAGGPICGPSGAAVVVGTGFGRRGVFEDCRRETRGLRWGPRRAGGLAAGSGAPPRGAPRRGPPPGRPAAPPAPPRPLRRPVFRFVAERAPSVHRATWRCGLHWPGWKQGHHVKTWTSFGIAIVIAVGAMLPLQALVNARLGALTHGAGYASFVSFLVGTCLLGSILLLSRTPLLPAQPLASLPAWIWAGGAIGASLVLVATALVPRLGAAGLFCLVVLGQVLGSLLLDHYGVLGPRR